MKIRIAFVILHYLTYFDTRECVDSIKKNIGSDEYRIIIVDNNSRNGSYESLQNAYSEDEHIVFLHNEENLGFAKGNNVGFQYAKNAYNPDYIVFCNNDICLIQADFLKSLDDISEETRFYIYGPAIISKDGKCNCNPMNNTIYDLKDIDKMIGEIKWDYIKAKYYLSNPISYHIMRIIKTILGRTRKNNEFCYTKQENVKLHGSFMVFSKLYIESYDGIDPRTFLYFEEDILYLKAIKTGIKTVYDPRIVVFHKEDSATNAISADQRKKRMMKDKYLIDSMNIYRLYMQENFDCN